MRTKYWYTYTVFKNLMVYIHSIYDCDGWSGSIFVVRIQTTVVQEGISHERLEVPAEYAGASSGSGDHPQQYYLHHPKLTSQ